MAMPKNMSADARREKGAAIVRRYREGQRYATNFHNRIDLLAPYVEGTRGNVQGQAAAGQALLSRMYDSEGISSADLAVRQIGSYLHGPGSKWLSLYDANPIVNEDDEAREWYEECRDRMLRIATAGGFHPESYECDMDWAVFGTGSMRAEERPLLPYESYRGFNGMRFTSFKAGRFIAFENGVGEVDESYTEIRKTARAAANLWGLENLPDLVRQAYQSERSDEFCFVQGIYPRSAADKDKGYGNTKMPFASCVAHLDSTQLVHESGYLEFPDMVPRWSRCSGEPYGRGLGEIALNSLITLNAATKHDLEAMMLRIKPPLAQRHDSVIGQKRFTPWGVTVVRVAPGEPVTNAMAPLVTNHGNYSFSQVDSQRLREQIRRIFYADMLEQLMALEGQQEMRVYVFQQKQNIVQKMLGPTYGRWEAEFGFPFVTRVFNVMYRAGAFSPPPDIVLELGGQPRVKFESPLARAQRMEETDAMSQAMADLQPIVELQLNEWKMTGRQPSQWALDAYNFDAFTETVNMNRGVPAAVTNSRKQIMALRQSRAIAEQKSQQSQQLMQLAEGAGKAAPALKLLEERGA